MSLEPEQEREHQAADPFASDWSWRGGALGGLIATAAMGLVISIADLTFLRVAIAGLYGFGGNLAVGWVAHLGHGTLFGLIFAGFLADPALYRVSEEVWKTVVAAVVYAMMLSTVGAGIIMPIWLNAVGFPDSPTIPHVTTPILIWHLVYGVVLGLVFPFVEELDTLGGLS